MRMNSLLTYTPEPGDVVEWRPSAATLDAAAEAERHSSPPSYFQQSHISRAVANDAAGKVHSPWLATIFDLPGRLDVDAMAAAWQRWVRRHGTLLTWFEGTPDELRRYALAAGDVAFDPVEVGTFSSGEQIRSHLLERFSGSTSPLQWPPFVLGAVLREESSTVFFAVDHSHTDGYSIFLVFDELRQLYQEETGGPAAQLPEVGDHAEFAALERQREVSPEMQAEATATWTDFLSSGNGKPPSFPLPLGIDGDEPQPMRLLERQLFDNRTANVFTRTCRSHGGGFAAGIFAALAIASYELTGQQVYRTLTPVQTRDEARWAATQGWFINLVPVHFDVAGESSFAGVLDNAEKAFARARAIGDLPMLKLVELLGGSLQLRSDSRTVLPMVSFIDTRRIRGSELWEQANCQVLGGPGSGFDVPMWINRLREQTYLKASYPETAVAEDNVARYVEHARDILHRVTDDGDHPVRATPHALATAPLA